MCNVFFSLWLIKVMNFCLHQDCLGDIDGSHVRAKVARADAPRFRGRKDWPTQNICAACDFDMKFTYVLAGWEGTASDSRILKDVLVRGDPLVIPEGQLQGIGCAEKLKGCSNIY